MTAHGYNKGRLNLPFVGISTFAKSPFVEDWDAIEADIAVLGAPFDSGTQWRSGARFGPKAIREASMLFSFGHSGAYDHEDDITYLDDSVRIVDIGDADIIHTKTDQSHKNIEIGVRKILRAGALPVVLGGDHSVNIPCINAFEEFCGDNGPIHIVQIDAHLDFVDERHGVTAGHGDAKSFGSDILSVRQIRKLGVEQVIKRVPSNKNIYVTIDIDAFCPSIAAGTGTPSHGGFLYYEVLEVLQGLSEQNNIVGIDLVEVAPAYDPSESTQILAAQILLNFLGFISYFKSKRA